MIAYINFTTWHLYFVKSNCRKNSFHPLDFDRQATEKAVCGGVPLSLKRFADDWDNSSGNPVHWPFLRGKAIKYNRLVIKSG